MPNHQFWPIDLDGICWDPKPRMTPEGLRDDNGVDVDLIRENLKLTPTERLRRAEERRLQYKPPIVPLQDRRRLQPMVVRVATLVAAVGNPYIDVERIKRNAIRCRPALPGRKTRLGAS